MVGRRLRFVYVDKRYNLSIRLSTVYSLLYISFAEADKSQGATAIFSFGKFQNLLAVSFFLVRKKCFDQIKVILCSYVQCDTMICQTVFTDILICGSLCFVIADLYKQIRYRGRCWPALRNSMHALRPIVSKALFPKEKIFLVQASRALFLPPASWHLTDKDKLV